MLQFLTDTKSTHQGKDSLINTLCLGNWISIHRLLKLDTFHSVGVKSAPNRPKIVRLETPKLYEETGTARYW